MPTAAATTPPALFTAGAAKLFTASAAKLFTAGATRLFTAGTARLFADVFTAVATTEPFSGLEIGRCCGKKQRPIY